MAQLLTTQQRAYINQMRDLVAMKATSTVEPFLYFLPQLFETGFLNAQNAQGGLQLVQIAYSGNRPQIIISALDVLNQMITEEGTFIPPTPQMFAGNKYFKWEELGKYTDPKNAVMHVFNRTVTALKMGKRT